MPNKEKTKRNETNEAPATSLATLATHFNSLKSPQPRTYKHKNKNCIVRCFMVLPFTYFNHSCDIRHIHWNHKRQPKTHYYYLYSHNEMSCLEYFAAWKPSWKRQKNAHFDKIYWSYDFLWATKYCLKIGLLLGVKWHCIAVPMTIARYFGSWKP